MNAGPDVERLIASWLVEEAPARAPDRILDAAGRVIDRTNQRRFVAAWRLPDMSSASRMVAAAVIVMAVGLGAFLALSRPASGPGSSASPAVTGTPSPQPSASGPLTVCGLVSSAEVANAADPGLGATSFESGSGATTSCTWSDGGGNVIVRLSLTSPGGQTAFEGVRAGPGVQVVPDIGDDAVFDPALDTLYVLKGDALVEIAAKQVPGTTYVLSELANELGTLIATRL